MRKLSVVLLVILCVICLAPSVSAFAEEASTASIYTGVLEDLQLDETFDVSAYPAVSNSRQLDVIQVAESNANELFIYVYQPGEATVTVTSINISQGINDNLKYVNYELERIDREGTLGKYLVKGIKIQPEILRYYDISVIYRKPIGDEKGENVAQGDRPNASRTEEVGVEVGKRFSALTYGGVVSYAEQHTDTVEIRNPFVDYVEYFGGLGWEVLFALGAYYTRSTDVRYFYVGFSTNYDIDALYEVDIQYKLRAWKANDWFWGGIEGDKEYTAAATTEQVTINAEEVAPNPKQDGYIFGHAKFQFKPYRIQSVDDFIETESKLSDSTQAKLRNDCEWVIRFHEETVNTGNIVMGVYQRVTSKDVTAVQILRLKFLMNGKTYNLGTVMNKVSPDDVAGNKDTGFGGAIASWWEAVKNFFKKTGSFCADWWWVILIILICIAIAILSAIFKPVWNIVKQILLVIWWVISAPARLIVLIVNSIQKRAEKGTNAKT